MKLLAIFHLVASILFTMNDLLPEVRGQSIHFLSHRDQAQVDDKRARHPLEVRLSTSPLWKKDCLLVTVERINRSSVPIFLTKMGQYFYMALDVSKEQPGESVKWVNVYGNSDIRTLEASPLARGAIDRGEFSEDTSAWKAAR